MVTATADGCSVVTHDDQAHSPASTDWDKAIDTLRSERRTQSEHRGNAQRFLDKLFSGAQLQEIGGLGQDRGGSPDGLLCGWCEYDSQPYFVVIEDESGLAPGYPKPVTAIAKTARIQQLARQRSWPIIERVALPRRSQASTVGAEFGIYGYGIDFNGQLRLRENSPRCVLMAGEIYAETALECALADYVVHVSVDTVEEHGNLVVDAVVEDESDGITRIHQYLELVIQRQSEEPPGQPQASPFLWDEDSWLVLKPVSKSALSTGLARVAGNTVGVARFIEGTLDTSACQRLIRLIQLCEFRKLPLLWVLEGDVDMQMPLRYVGNVVRTLRNFTQPICQIQPDGKMEQWSESTALLSRVVPADNRILLDQREPLMSLRQCIASAIANRTWSP